MVAVTIDLINTGTELMLGRILNSHQQWICRQLADRGYAVDRQVAVADTAPAIEAAVRDALARADLVITTGGLGPTSDDLTRERIAVLLGRGLREDPAVLQSIEAYFALRRRPMPASTRAQARVPEGADVLPNPHGTAPGLALLLEPNPFRTGGSRSLLIMLPGPPRELRPMLLDQVLPLLRRHLPRSGTPVTLTLKSTGLGESAVEERIGPRLRPFLDRGLNLGYCARVGEVEIRLSADHPQAAVLVREAEAVVRAELGDYIYGVDEETFESLIVRLLAERQQTLALAESCTGGFIGHRLTNVPGASGVLLASLVTYSNRAKELFLDVPTGLLAEHGAVSEACARAMAQGARQRTGADMGLAVTGIAGPAGATADKPVGTVWIALADPLGVTARACFNPVDRETFKYVVSQQAFEMLRRHLLRLA
jgi:nicotinamide-nucleotide amidase